MFASSNVDEMMLILLLLPPPELHLLIGPVNTIYDAMNKVWPGSEVWLKKVNVKREEYHGGSFNGNDSRMLLKNFSSVEESSPSVKGYIDTFNSFNEVVKSCYGTEMLPDYEEKIKQFRISYKQLKINVTPKVHAVFHHVGEFCGMVNKGLVTWSEQAAESLHSDFTKMWQNYKLRDTDHDQHGERLLDAILAYNSQHM